MTAPTYAYVHLSPVDVIRERPFTDVGLNADDLWAMRRMAGQLHELLNGPEDIPDAPRPLQINLSDADGGYGRFVLNHTEVLQSAQNLYLVGFFGQRRPGAGRIAIDEMDMTLQGEFGAYPAVLGYCTMRLSDGNYGNLVLISVDSVREHWRESTHHQYAAAELAPAYYASVRLHNALLRGGLKPEPDIQLARTKYYDYQNGFWCGLRELI